MKKLFAILLVITMLLSMAACGGKPQETTPPTQTDPAVETTGEEQNPLSYTFTQYGNAKITVVGAEFIKDDDGADVLRVYYDYTNTSDTACGQAPVRSMHLKSITQDGQECEDDSFDYMDDCAIAEDLVSDCPTLPGCTSRHTMLINCDPNGGIIEISCYIMVGSWMYNPDDVQCFTFQIDPKNMMGAPEALVMPAIMNPTYAAGLPTSGTNESLADISIDGCELTKGDEGEDILRVKLTVTNNGSETWPASMLINGVEVYQDGFGLLMFSDWQLEESTDADAAYTEDLAPGKTVQCNALFELRNDHPAEVVIEDLSDDLRLGMIFDIKAALEAIEADKQAQQQAADQAAAAAKKALVGTWLQRDSDWEDTYIFNADGTGMLISGPEYPFTYSVTDDTLTLVYDPEDTEDFTFSVSGDLLTLIDQWGDELLLDKQVAGDDQSEATVPAELTVRELTIGTWEDQETEYRETFTFNEDGTGLYSFEEGGHWEYAFTYAWYSDDYMEITYEDGSVGGFYVRIEGDVMYVTNDAVSDMPLIRK